MATIFSSVPELALACLVLAVAEAVYVTFGFGAGLIAVGALAAFMPRIEDVVVLLLLVSLPAETLVVATSWRQIRWRGVLLVCVGMAVGVPLGTRLLQTSEPTILLTLLGGLLVAAGAAFLLVPGARPVRWPRWVAPLAGLGAGVLDGLFGTSGPPLILYYQLGATPKAAFRGSLMAIFLSETLVRVPVYALSGLITVPRLLSALAVLPAVALGAWLGQRIQLDL
ncbi:MAG: sulfite exporter TauE/SafE family protein, partial [Deltaproteobacteria bacterium]|nr:sulfite exporter TauE/SafE family protein [Deltaproteobacteria bacterium]